MLLVGLVVALGGATISPPVANGFVGESQVIDPVTKALTPAAEAVFKQGKLVPEIITKAGAAGGVAAAGEAAGVLQAGRVVPVLGSVLAFGVGAKIGSEICNVLGISGCWGYASDVADPALGEGSWKFREEGPFEATRGTLPFQFYYFGTSGVRDATFEGVAGNPPGCGLKPPGGVTQAFAVPSGSFCTPPGGGAAVETKRAILMRSSMANRTFEYHAADDPGIPNYSYTAPTDWPKKMGAAIAAGTDAADKVGQHVASQIPGSGVSSPYALTVEIPNCDGLLYPACEELLEERGLKVTRVTRTWQTADTDAEPDEVLELDPARSTEVEKGSTVTVITNPDEAGMPIVIPTPEPGETYQQYAARLNPGLSPTRVDVGEAYVDPYAGPDAVLTVQPKPGTRVDPTMGEEVTVRTNPPTAPPGGGGGGGTCAASVGAVDLGPLNQPLGDQFPFGVISFFVTWTAEWTFVDAPPKFELQIWDSLPWTIDLAVAEPILEPIRIALLLASFIGFLWFLATAAMKLQGDNS